MVRCKQGNTPVSAVVSENIALDSVTEANCALPELSVRFSWTDLVGILFSIGSYLFDAGSDIVVAYIHYRNGHYWYFGLTVTFVIVPAITMTAFTTVWYIEEHRKRARKISSAHWAVRIMILVLQMGPVLKYVDSLLYGLKSRKKEKTKKQLFYYQKMIYEDCDAAFLRLFEAFMEAAPQLVLQIYIITKNSPHSINDLWTVIFQGLTIFTSLVSLSWALAYYHRSLRLSVPEKNKISWFGTITQIFWYFFVIAARVLSLGLLAFLSPVGLAVFSVAHWAIMFGWIMTMKTTFCETRFQEIMYNMVLGIVFIFSYLNPVDRPTRYKYTFYYVVTFIENTIIMGLWYHFCTNPLLWFRLPALLFHFLSFAVGIFIMIFYYLLLHPSGNIKVVHTNHIAENGIEKENKQDHISQSEC